MRLIFSIIMLSSWLFSYYGKVLPIDSYTLKSNVNGQVIFTNKSLEGKSLDNEVVVKVDDFDDEVNLHSFQSQKESVLNQMKFYKNILKEQQNILRIKQDNYKIFKNLKSKSKTEKDAKYLDFISAEISINQTRITLSNLNKELDSIDSNIKKLKKTITDKSIKIKGYLYKLFVDKDDFVTYGSTIAIIKDISKVKIDIFIPINKISTIKDKDVYINGKKSDFVVSKVYKVADEKYVTSYKVELVGSYATISDVVKVEFK